MARRGPSRVSPAAAAGGRCAASCRWYDPSPRRRFRASARRSPRTAAAPGGRGSARMRAGRTSTWPRWRGARGRAGAPASHRTLRAGSVRAGPAATARAGRAPAENHETEPDQSGRWCRSWATCRRGTPETGFSAFQMPGTPRPQPGILGQRPGAAAQFCITARAQFAPACPGSDITDAAGIAGG